MSEDSTTTVKGNEWMSETVTSIAYKEEIAATVRILCMLFLNNHY